MNNDKLIILIKKLLINYFIYILHFLKMQSSLSTKCWLQR